MSSYSYRSVRQSRPSVTSARPATSARPRSTHGRLVQDVDDNEYDYQPRRPHTRASHTRTTRSYLDDDYDVDDYGIASSHRSRSYYDDDTLSFRSSHYGGSSHVGQVQAQRQTFRSAQASKQMVLGVYQNCITMLEEMESREMRHQGRRAMARSDIHLPSQAGHDDKTIQRKLDTQLLLLQSQIQSCDADIRDEVKDEMTDRVDFLSPEPRAAAWTDAHIRIQRKLDTQLLLLQSQIQSCDADIRDEVKNEMADSTLEWTSGRQDRGLPHGQTDKYAGKLLEVVQTGKTKHPKVFSKPPTIGERGMRDAMQAIMIGNHRRDKLDEEYRAQSDKRAARLRLRPGSGVSGGAERMLGVRPDLHRGLDRYVESSLR